MTQIQQFDYTADLKRVIPWQYNDAEKLQAWLQNKQDFFDENSTQFWQNWYDNVFNLNTCNSFGISVWAIILDLPLLINIPPFNPNRKTFGFGQFNKNFNNGNFAPASSGGGGASLLTLEQKRLALKMRYKYLVSRGTVPEINQIMKSSFGDLGNSYVRDNLDMTITYVFEFSIPPWIEFLIDELRVMPTPSAVDFDLEEI